MAQRLRKLAASVTIGVVLSILQPFMLSQTPTTGALTGRVSDATDAILANATVQLVSNATGAQTSVTSDQNGNFRFSLLPPGSYTVRSSAAGFKTEVSTNVTINVTETSTLNMKLTIGQQQETIEVESGAVLLQSENATLGTTVQGATIQASLWPAETTPRF